jgi:signal transduction histidine kinase
MSLASVRAQLKPEQEDASVRLEQSRAALNETIRDVRNFITGLEPEGLRERSFSQAVTSLLSFMQSVRTFRAITTIDDAAAAHLTLSQRAHALQIAREAVSNALRHGEAAEVAVSLGAKHAGIEFEIRDNGCGFVPGATPRPPGSGHGLANFTRRAHEIGAELILRSEIGRGTSVRLIFPPNL